ncbi:hypothetical protein ACUSIJ_18720 [Pseudochelatococcus sp. B33]
MDEITILLWVLALVCGIVVWRKHGDAAASVFPQAVRTFVGFLPRLVLALLAAGFISKLVPADAVADLIGKDSGLGGVLIASFIGGFVPGGPIISFPIVVVLRDAGTGPAQLIAFLTAWSVLAIHRVLIYESTLMGWRFSALRLGSSVVLAPLAGCGAMLLYTILQ